MANHEPVTLGKYLGRKEGVAGIVEWTFALDGGTGDAWRDVFQDLLKHEAADDQMNSLARRTGRGGTGTPKPSPVHALTVHDDPNTDLGWKISFASAAKDGEKARELVAAKIAHVNELTVQYLARSAKGEERAAEREKERQATIARQEEAFKKAGH